MEIHLTAYTYWGTGEKIKVSLRSPLSVPSAPSDLHYYVTHQYKYNFNTAILITLRWKPPITPNGIIKGYKICWCINESNNYECVEISSNALEYYFDNALKDTMYLFKVCCVKNV